MSKSEVVFQSFSSGSSGNCYLYGRRGGDAVLVDAGVSLRTLSRAIPAAGFALSSIKAVLITHDHSDHIRSLGSYAKRLGVPIWASAQVHAALSRYLPTKDRVPPCAKVFRDGEWNEILPGGVLSAMEFTVPHDATRTCGLALRLADHFIVHISDCGRMTDEALSFLRQADTVILESNYDTRMLLEGTYPKELQDRIRSGHGHLSNDECAEAIRSFAGEKLHSLFLCHLSAHNNTPEKALESARAALGGREVRLLALPRTTPSMLLTL